MKHFCTNTSCPDPMWTVLIQPLPQPPLCFSCGYVMQPGCYYCHEKLMKGEVICVNCSKLPVSTGNSPSPVSPGNSPSPVSPGNSPLPVSPGNSPSPVSPGYSPLPVSLGYLPLPISPGYSWSPVSPWYRLSSFLPPSSRGHLRSQTQPYNSNKTTCKECTRREAKPFGLYCAECTKVCGVCGGVGCYECFDRFPSKLRWDEFLAE